MNIDGISYELKQENTKSSPVACYRVLADEAQIPDLVVCQTPGHGWVVLARGTTRREFGRGNKPGKGKRAAIQYIAKLIHG